MAQTTFWSGLSPASFRNIPFDCMEEHKESSGRRIVTHEFPLQDIPYSEDLGKKATEFTVEAFILRNKWQDYEEIRDNLRKALAEKGAGTLIHAWLGEMQVCVTSFSVRETTKDGGYCKFSINFVEAGKLEEPDVNINTQSKVLEVCAKAEEVTITNFLDSFKNLPEDIMGIIQFLSQTLDILFSPIQNALQFIRKIKNALESLVDKPTSLADELKNTVKSILSYNQSNELPLDINSFTTLLQKRVEKPQSSYIYFSENVSTVKSRAITPLIDYISATTCIEQAKKVASTDFMHTSEALEAFTNTNELIDIVQSSCVNDKIFHALEDIRITLKEDVTQRTAKLPSLFTYIPSTTMPALALSYLIYGDIKQAKDLVSRNKISHPGRIEGGKVIEVIK